MGDCVGALIEQTHEDEVLSNERLIQPCKLAKAFWKALAKALAL